MTNNYKIFGIPFINGGFKQAISILKNGGLMVVPAAPALATIQNDKKYYDAILNADFAIPDSGFMLLILRLLKGIKMNKFSGYSFLHSFFDELKINNSGTLFLVDPTIEDSEINNKFLNEIDIMIKKSNHYCAPIYDKKDIIDYELLKIIEKVRPKFIMINLGGGVQERLGSFLKNNLSYKPGIICTGAAIAFFTGSQANIPLWIDNLYFGWLWRCIKDPKIFIPRYLMAFKLYFILSKEKIIKMEKL